METRSSCEKLTSQHRQFVHPCLSLLAALALLAATASAQTFVGSIGGIVTDTSGASAPDVSVIVTDQATGVRMKTVTNKDGNYQVSFLSPSVYSIEFQKDGFEQNVAKDLTLVMNQKLRLDTVLKPGNVQQSVSVTAEATQLNRTSSDIAGEIGQEDLVNMPETFGTHGASVLNLVSLFAGVASSSADYSNPNNVSLGGGRPDTVPIIIDGLPSNMGADNTYGLVPTPDSTQQLQVLTSAFSAQYGQTGGGAILTTSRSGTSSLHGAFFEYHNNQDLDALNFFTPPGTKRTRNIFNYFGGSLGGPAYIPKIYDGKKHQVFFFTDTEYTINPSEKVTLADVPTLAEQSGNFSGPTPQGTPVTVYDPTTTATANGKTTRQPFPNDTIPTNRIDPVGAKIAAFYPHRTAPSPHTTSASLPTRTTPICTIWIESTKISAMPTASGSATATMRRPITRFSISTTPRIHPRSEAGRTITRRPPGAIFFPPPPPTSFDSAWCRKIISQAR